MQKLEICCLPMLRFSKGNLGCVLPKFTKFARLKRFLKPGLFSAESVSNFITCISEARCLQEVPICVCFSISFQDAIGLTRLMQLKTTEAPIGFIENAHRLPPSLKISKVSRMNTECNSIEK